MEPNNNQLNRFMMFEKLFFRIILSIFTLGVAIYFIFMAFLDKLGETAEMFITGFFLIWILIIAIFFISIGRILRFIITFKTAEGVTIWRSVLSLFLSPVAFVLYYILIFVASISSCTYVG